MTVSQNATFRDRIASACSPHASPHVFFEASGSYISTTYMRLAFFRHASACAYQNQNQNHKGSRELKLSRTASFRMLEN